MRVAHVGEERGYIVLGIGLSRILNQVPYEVDGELVTLRTMSVWLVIGITILTVLKLFSI